VFDFLSVKVSKISLRVTLLNTVFSPKSLVGQDGHKLEISIVFSGPLCVVKSQVFLLPE